MQQKTVLCNDRTRLYTTRNVCKQTYVVESREKQMQQKTVLCNDRTRLYTTRNVCKQTYVVKSREKQMQQKLCYATTKHDFARQEMHAGKLMS